MDVDHLDQVGFRLTGGCLANPKRTERRTWIGEHVVASVVDRRHLGRAGNPHREAELVDTLRRRGVRTPEPLDIGGDDDATWVLWRRVDGVELRGDMLGDPVLAERMGVTVAEFSAAAACSWSDDIAEGHPRLPAWVPTTSIAAVEARVDTDLHDVFDTVVGFRAHQDLHPGNMIVDRRQHLWVVDFERFGPAAGASPHGCELAYIAAAGIRGGWVHHISQWCPSSPEAGLADPHVRAVAANLVARVGGHLHDGTATVGRVAALDWLRRAART